MTFKPSKKNNPCPVCGDTSGKCRTTDTELILCMNTHDANSTPDGWKFKGLSDGGGHWGKIVPAGQPESGNALALRKQREAERSAVEAARMGRLKPAKQRHEDYQYQVANCPILEADQADLTRRGLTDEDLKELTPINDGKGGYTIPIRDKDGLMVGGQRRLTGEVKGGRYRWATTGENQLPETKELPLAHWKGDGEIETIALVEGTGVKPYLAAKKLKSLAIGAAGGNFAASSKTLKATLDRHSDLHVVLVPDAGAVANKSVMRQYANVQALLDEWGRELKVVWWDQKTKGDGDIDEIDKDSFTSEISWAEFVVIATEMGTAPPLSQPVIEVEKGETEKEDRATISERVLKLAFAAEYFITPDKATYADIRVNGVRETHSIRSRAFRLWITGQFYEAEEKAINANAMAEVLGVLDARAYRSNIVQEVNLRAAEHEGKLYIDLGSANWSAVEIDAQGWRIVAEPPIRFTRPESLLALPTPIEGGSLDELKELINVNGDSWVLIATFLLSCFRPNKTYPVLVLSAVRGSGKTAAAEILKGLIDPGKGSLIKLTNDTRNLASAAVNRWLMVYDNVGYISPDQSDDLCRMATNFGFSTRTLHTTAEETTLEFTRPQIITAIDALVTRDDLADRVLMAQLGEITEVNRLAQAELASRTEAARPRILGALFTALSQTLAKLPDTRPESLPRMADYALFSIAAEQALGLEPGEFMEVFNRSREQSRQVVIEASPIGEAIMRMMEQPSNSIRWKGTAAQLLNSLESFSDEATVRSRYWPKAANSFKRQLNRLIPDLGALGLAITESRKAHTGERFIHVEHKLKISSPSSPSPEASDSIISKGDDKGDDTFTEGDDTFKGDDTVTIEKRGTVTPQSDTQKELELKGDDGDDINTSIPILDDSPSPVQKNSAPEVSQTSSIIPSSEDPEEEILEEI